MRKIFNILLILVSLLIYACVLVPPDIVWLAGFFAYTIPAILIFNALLFIWRIKNLQFSAIYPFALLLIGWGFITDSISFNASQEEGQIKVITFNTRVFNVYSQQGNDTLSVNEMINWVKEQDADILCFQEFYNHDKSDRYNTVAKISALGYSYFFKPIVRNPIGAEFGTIIFSKYPVTGKGVIDFSQKSNNNVIFTDLLIRDDTIRVYNMHLHSMHIDEKKVINPEDIQAGVRDLAGRLKDGFISRSVQIRKLEEHVSSLGRPVLLCGDLNDLPYSYAYRQLDKSLNNGFEQSGNGFGFTFNGNLFFLRIDHHFFSDQFEINGFITHREMKSSDHFPVSAEYSLK